MTELSRSPPTSALPSPGVLPSSPSGGTRFTLSGFLPRRPRAGTTGGSFSRSANGGLPSPTSPGPPSVISGETTGYGFPVLSGRSRQVSGRSAALAESREGSRSRSNSASAVALSHNPTAVAVETLARSQPSTPVGEQADPMDAAIQPAPTAGPSASTATGTSSAGAYSHIRLIPHLEIASRSLHFEPVNRQMRTGSTHNSALRIGRFNDRGPQAGPNDTMSSRIAFRSKVVSRAHAEISIDLQSNLWVKDCKSSSGTFLNHIRLSGPGLESRLYPLKDGDILQLGVDYQGGTEEMYRCVKMKVEVNRHKQKTANQFNVNALKQIRALGASGPAPPKAGSAKTTTAAKTLASDSSSDTDCCICLFAVTVLQSLFIAPCSHVYHYKCIRPLLQMHYPGFSCPLCRTFADLDADVEQEDEVASDIEEADAADEQDDDTQSLPTVLGASSVQSQAAEGAAVSTHPVTHVRASRRSSTASRRAAAMEDVPDAGDFQMDIRRASINVSGPRGTASPIAITGRTSRPPSLRSLSRPASVFNLDMTASNSRSLAHRSSVEQIPVRSTSFGANGLSPPMPSDFATSMDFDDADLLPGAFMARQPTLGDGDQQVAEPTTARQPGLASPIEATARSEAVATESSEMHVD